MTAPSVASSIDAPAAEQVLPAGIALLVRAIAAGDTSAFAEFYETWFDRALDLARHLTRRDDHFCLDIVQDAMLRAARSLSPRLGITTRQDLDRWMTRVVHTTALDVLRKESRRRVREQRGPRRSPVRRDPIASEAASSDAREQVLLAERITWIRAELDTLDAAERDLLMARFAGGRTVAQAAMEAGTSAGSATGRLTRVLARLRQTGREWFRDDSGSSAAAIMPPSTHMQRHQTISPEADHQRDHP
ncbi:MAG: RNA polymerase sigma factor [Phycisphaerales bacterium]